MPDGYFQNLLSYVEEMIDCPVYVQEKTSAIFKLQRGEFEFSSSQLNSIDNYCAHHVCQASCQMLTCFPGALYKRKSWRRADFN